MGNKCSNPENLTNPDDFLSCFVTPYDRPNRPGEVNLAAPISTILGGRAQEMSDPVYDFYYQCLHAPYNPEVGLVCFNNVSYNKTFGLGNYQDVRYVGPQQHSPLVYNLLVVAFFVSTRQRLIDLCGADKWEDTWPQFYHLYNSVNGKAQVEAFIDAMHKAGRDLPPACIAALKANYTDDIQKRYGLINVPDVTTMSGIDWGCNEDVGNGNFSGPMCNPSSVVYGPDYFLSLNFNDSAPYWNADKQFGNPLWSHKDRQLAMMQIIGKDWNTGKSFVDQWVQAYVDIGFLDPGKSPVDWIDPAQQPGKPNPFTDPDYIGNLPYKPPYNIPGNEPWHLATADPTGYGYVNPCTTKPELDKLMPVVAFVAGAAIAAIGVPGHYAKLMGAATLGVSASAFVGGTLGWSALTADNSGKEVAANVISAGAPATLMMSLLESGFLPDVLTTQGSSIVLLIGAAGVGYATLIPIVKPVLLVSGDVITFATAPIAFLEGAVSYLFGGCAAHQITFHYVCDCEAAANKPLMQDALLGPIYGCTEQQLALRKQALQARMMTGTWGPDPVAIGSCDSQGHMDNILACVSAGEWAYQNWPSDFDATAKQAWAEIADVFDPDNPSFLPPKPTDMECVRQAGKYFRSVDGKCVDTRAPLGMQGPGQFQWPEDSSEGWCAIL